MQSALKQVFVPLLWRTALSAVPFGLGWYLLSTVTELGDVFRVFVGAFAIAVPGFIMAPPLATLFGDLSGEMFFPDSRNSKPPPGYSLPQAKRICGLPRESLELYDEITVEHPQELKAYLEMIDIAAGDLKDMVLADEIGKRAVMTLTDQDAKQKVKAAFRELKRQSHEASGNNA